MNENENRTYYEVWGVAEMVLTGKIITLNNYIRKEEINDPYLHLKKLEKEE